MPGLINRLFGIAVISAGVCAALPFRTDPSSQPAQKGNTANSTSTHVQSDALTLQLTIPASPLPLADNTVPVSAKISKNSDKLSQPLFSELPTQEDLQIPPSVAPSFEALGEGSSSLKRSERRYQVTDGDTLQRLAQRYLGDQEKWRIILAANRNLITDPDVLPLGIEITIPLSSNDELIDDLVPIHRP